MLILLKDMKLFLRKDNLLGYVLLFSFSFLLLIIFFLKNQKKKKVLIEKLLQSKF